MFSVRVQRRRVVFNRESIYVERGAAEAFLAAQIGHAHAGISLADESDDLFVCVPALAHRASSRLRGFCSFVLVRIAGSRSPQQAVAVAGRLHELGCYEISVADTVRNSAVDYRHRHAAVIEGRPLLQSVSANGFRKRPRDPTDRIALRSVRHFLH
jgi:hypothetical protein